MKLEKAALDSYCVEPKVSDVDDDNVMVYIGVSHLVEVAGKMRLDDCLSLPPFGR